MSVRDQIASQIGSLVLANIELSASADEFMSLCESRHELLANLVRSGQLSADQVQSIVADEVFAVWYRKKYPAST